ncbi:hypothetical protein DYI22_10450 [Marinobacter lipolyticus]|uniref:hypothetical protein n=1 Tax=Marinobacter lipolyticus TaxID=209639 RepID=UPI001BCA9E3E|nr:hypothetical protein [Marinobacter lipolyticus]MBS8240920.1 hypothetical protein [Marinobacter lipolyticus]
MKFPKATVILVSAALIFIAWDLTRDKREPGDTSRFTNLASHPAARSEVVDWVISRIPELCVEIAGQPAGSPAHAECVDRSESRHSLCRRAIYGSFPEVIRSEAAFRDVTLTMMDCLVQ